MSKIKLIIAASLLLAGGLLAWYVQGLRAENADLNKELATAAEVQRKQEIDISKLVTATALTADRDKRAGRDIASLNKELESIRISHDAPEVDLAVAGAVADQLNRLFQPAQNNSH